MRSSRHKKEGFSKPQGMDDYWPAKDASRFEKTLHKLKYYMTPWPRFEDCEYFAERISGAVRKLDLRLELFSRAIEPLADDEAIEFFAEEFRETKKAFLAQNKPDKDAVLFSVASTLALGAVNATCEEGSYYYNFHSIIGPKINLWRECVDDISNPADRITAAKSLIFISAPSQDVRNQGIFYFLQMVPKLRPKDQVLGLEWVKDFTAPDSTTAHKVEGMLARASGQVKKKKPTTAYKPR